MTMQQTSACERTSREFVESSLMIFVKDFLNIEIQSSEDDLIETGLLDSLMLVDLVLHIEQAFSVSPSLEDLEIENFATVSRMADFVVARELGLASVVDTPVAVIPETQSLGA